MPVRLWPSSGWKDALCHILSRFTGKCDWFQGIKNRQIQLYVLGYCSLARLSPHVVSLLLRVGCVESLCWKFPLSDCSTVGLALLLPMWLLFVAFENCARASHGFSTNTPSWPSGGYGRPHAKFGPHPLKSVVDFGKREPKWIKNLYIRFFGFILGTLDVDCIVCLSSLRPARQNLWNWRITSRIIIIFYYLTWKFKVLESPKLM